MRMGQATGRRPTCTPRPKEDLLPHGSASYAVRTLAPPDQDRPDVAPRIWPPHTTATLTAAP
jgi:hypothetical protein